MSPSVSIRTVTTQKSGKRYIVRYRMGGRAHKLIHGGSFRRLTEARTRRDLIAGELAAGRDPRLLLRRLQDAPELVTVASAADAWLLTRVDLEPSSLDTYRDAVKWLKQTPLADLLPSEVTSAAIQEVVIAATIAPSSLQTYGSALKQILDYAGLDPNPARGRRVRWPKVERPAPRVPTAKQVDAIIEHARPSVKLVLRILAATGMRISELLERTWGDVDIDGSKILVVKGKTRSATRWVILPASLMDALLETCPPDDRARDQLLFSVADSTVRAAMGDACVKAKVPHFSPHDLRHRYISVLLKQGFSRAELADRVGHVNKNELATYEHVVIEDA